MKHATETCNNAQLTSIVDLTVFLEPYQEVFHELFRLCKIAAALPVSSDACERSFSALKLMKKLFADNNG